MDTMEDHLGPRPEWLCGVLHPHDWDSCPACLRGRIRLLERKVETLDDHRTEQVELDFDDLTPIEIPVRIAGKRYVLREASSDAAVKFRNAGLASARMEDGKVTGMSGLAETEPLLVSQCLFVANAEGRMPLDPQGNPDRRALVPIHTVKAWPYRMQKVLYDKIVEISDLKEDETQEGLEKQISALQKKLDRLRRRNGTPESTPQADGPEAWAKNEHGATADGSA